MPRILRLGLGLLVAMVYAMNRARRGQHRGLTLVSMAVGIAATLQCLAFALNPMGALERGDDLATQIGVYVGPSARVCSPRRSRATTTTTPTPTPGTPPATADRP